MGGKKLFFRRFLALLVLPAVAGQSCSSDDGQDDARAVLASCTNLLVAQCSYMAGCLPIFLGSQFGDVDTCVSRARLLCEGYAKWPGDSWTAEKFDRCSDQMKQITACVGFDGLSSGPCATEAGSLANGAACVDSSQCASGWCDRPITPVETSVCGTCRASGCLPGGCKAGERCIASSTGARCVQVQAEGGPCTSSPSYCAEGLSCLDSVCSKSRGESEPCTDPADCDWQRELTCIGNVCRKPNIVEIGAQCTGGEDRCAKGGWCYGAQLTEPRTCVAPLADGAPCGAGIVGGCTPPARCASGVCRLPAELTCP